MTPQTAKKEELEGGGKIIMPTSALEELSAFDIEHSAEIPHPNFLKNWKHVSTPHSAPMIFEISTEKGKRTFCGVEEFTAPEGNVVVPQWVMKNLDAAEKSSLQVRRVDLPSGIFLKLQPHSTDFLEVNDPKAMLEWVLPRFVVLCVG
jgi:ubiquitin fusion degradation protein 1